MPKLAGRPDKSPLHDGLMAAVGHQPEAILEEIMATYRDDDLLAVEGNPPLNRGGMHGIIGSTRALEVLPHRWRRTIPVCATNFPARGGFPCMKPAWRAVCCN